MRELFLNLNEGVQSSKPAIQLMLKVSPSQPQSEVGACLENSSDTEEEERSFPLRPAHFKIN